MPNQQNRYTQNLLNLLNSRVHLRQRQSRVHRANGYEVIAGMSDDTGIANNETENRIDNDIHILDCGHAFSGDNLGGECHYCDGLVFTRCILTCSRCGHSLCPQHLVIKDFGHQNRPYCRVCADGISRNLKHRSIAKTILSFFFDTNGRGC